MPTNDAFVNKMTTVMRDADKKFEDIGGSTRHYVRDVLLPLMEQAGLFIVDSEDISSAIKIITTELAKDKSAGSYYCTWKANIAMSFKDEFDRKGSGYTSKATIHLIANNAAKAFLDLLCSESENKCL